MKKMSKAEIALCVVLVAAIIINVFFAVGFFTNGTPAHWGGMVGVYCVLTFGFQAVKKLRDKEA